MYGVQNAVAGLRRAEREVVAQLAGIRVALSALAGSSARTGGPGRPAGSKNKPAVRKRRRLSAKARAAISAAQKARWAKVKKSA